MRYAKSVYKELFDRIEQPTVRLPEHRLLLAILMTAVLDASPAARLYVSDDNQERARNWLDDKDDLEWSCLWVLEQLFPQKDSKALQAHIRRYCEIF